MRDTEEPTAEFGVVAQAGDVTRGGNERFLHEVEARLFVMDQFNNINVKRQLVAAESVSQAAGSPARA